MCHGPRSSVRLNYFISSGHPPHTQVAKLGIFALQSSFVLSTKEVVMAFRIFPRDEGFFPLLEESSVIAHDCAKRISGILRSLPPAEVEIDAIMAAERRADEIVRELHRRLERSLVTPFDREDLQELMSKLDDVVDEMFAAADLIFLHRVTSELPGLFDMSQLLEEITLTNVTLMRNLSSFTGITELVEEIDQLESSADRMFRRVTGELFSGSHDALDILR